MRTYKYNGKAVLPNKELVLEDGTRWAKGKWNKLQEEYLESVGVTWVDTVPEQYDSRYYWSAGNPKDLDVLKASHIAQLHGEENSILSKTDWMFVKEADRNIKVPLNVRAYRDAITTVGNNTELAISACATVDDLTKLTYTWPEEDGDYSTWVPKTVTQRQARLALLSLGLLEAVEIAITDNEAAQIEWEYAQVIDRTSPLLTLLGKTDEELDELFRLAVQV